MNNAIERLKILVKCSYKTWKKKKRKSCEINSNRHYDLSFLDLEPIYYPLARRKVTTKKKTVTFVLTKISYIFLLSILSYKFNSRTNKFYSFFLSGFLFYILKNPFLFHPKKGCIHIYVYIFIVVEIHIWMQS